MERQKVALLPHISTEAPPSRLLPGITRFAWALVFIGLSVNLSCSQSNEQPEKQIRNVLFILADDHAAYALGAYGSSIAKTPNLDQLASEGVRFERAYCNSPVCAPSRQSLLTGRYPHAAGVTLLRSALPDGQVTIAEHLKASGFKTGAVGKMHFNNDLQHGFDFRVDGSDYNSYLEENPARKPPEGTPSKPVWRPFRDPARIWLNADTLPGTGYPRPSEWENQGLYDEDFTGTFFVNKAAEFLEQNKDDRFCLWLSFYEPHSPFNFPIEYADRFAASEMPVPAVGPEDDRWIPKVFRDLTEEDKRGVIASYYSSVAYLDANVGRILDTLERLGLDENTLVIYAGDHGYLLGHHGRFEKHMMWEEAVAVPLIIRDPRRRQAVSDAFVELVDLAPTITETLAVPVMETAQGKSLGPLLRGQTKTHRDFVFSEYYEDNKAMVRTREWKYVFSSGKNDLGLGYETGHGAPGRHQRLYNVINDPAESSNLAEDPQHAAVIGEMQSKMLEAFQSTDPRAAALPGGLTPEQQLEWFLEPPEGAGTPQ